MHKKRRFVHSLIFIAVFAASIAVIMVLWNWLIPEIIGWSTINYWQAAGLAVLCRLLFGGIGRKFHPGHFHGHHHHKHHHHLHEKLRDMSVNEKREFIRKRMAGMHDFTEEGQPHKANNHTDE